MIHNRDLREFFLCISVVTSVKELLFKLDVDFFVLHVLSTVYLNFGYFSVLS